MGGKIKRVECNTIIIAGATVSDGELTMYIYWNLRSFWAEISNWLNSS